MSRTFHGAAYFCRGTGTYWANIRTGMPSKDSSHLLDELECCDECHGGIIDTCDRCRESEELYQQLEEIENSDHPKELPMSDRKQAPILTEPFTHAQVDDYYAEMYRHVVADPKPPLDFKTLVAVHNFFEFEANSGMMLDAWLHAELQKVTGTSYLAPEEENKAEKYGW